MSPSRLDALDWASLEQHLDQYGYAIVRSLLSAQTCERLSACIRRPNRFVRRSSWPATVSVAGIQVLQLSLPTTVERLRTALYAPGAAG
jgi:hypothetical protein